MNISIGCTGWSYPGWSGTFYPKKMKSSEWLKYYSQIFSITEINSTFYQIPNQSITSKWRDSTPEEFRFAVKFPALITHEKQLDGVRSDVFSFLASLTPLYEKITALLIQLPPSLSFYEAVPKMEELFSMLPEDFLYPIEGRHESWFSDDAIRYLRKNKRCLVWNDVIGVKNTMPVTSNQLYIRLIGDRSIPDSNFGKITIDRTESIKKWAKKITSQNMRHVDVLANNHFEGFGPATANKLRREIGMSELIWEEKKQNRLV